MGNVQADPGNVEGRTKVVEGCDLNVESGIEGRKVAVENMGSP
ncbi:hypothetical protein ACQCU1_05550 [Sutcliffiella horikoshii]